MKPLALRLDRLETRIAPAVTTWDGGGADNHWTTAANWAGDVAPQPGDDLVFPAGAARLTNLNDFATGTAFHSLKITGPRYHLTGNEIALAAWISGETVYSPDPNDMPDIGLPLTLTADQTFDNTVGSERYTLSAAVNVNGQALTFVAGNVTI